MYATPTSVWQHLLKPELNAQYNESIDPPMKHVRFGVESAHVFADVWRRLVECFGEVIFVCHAPFHSQNCDHWLVEVAVCEDERARNGWSHAM